ncbi:MAG: hypothetical protein HYR66_08380 [Sphingobacteriales bacterium]|nr:hypothetical protein [Sphingobacteriales bacterium]MBI3720015.1 hypothetical protein [Sphingobacteriales bacterium]
MGSEGQKFSDNPEENLRLENQFLRMKLQAEYGSDLQMPMGNMPPELENQFLKNIFSFEEAYQKQERTTVYKLIGEPSYKKPEEMPMEQISGELKRLLDIMKNKNIDLHVEGEYGDKLILDFLINELFPLEVQANLPEGMMLNFSYEEFHPDHALDLRNLTVAFLQQWRERLVNEYAYQPASHFILPDGRVLSYEGVQQRLKHFFDAFTAFTNWKDGFAEASYEFMPDGTGLANVDGAVSYDAVLENGESIHFEGPLKIYFSNQFGSWEVFLFHMPGFNW